MDNESVQLGERVRDTVTGFQGIVTVVSDHLYGCRRIGVKPQVDEDGTSRETEFFDEPRLEVLGDGIREEWLEKRAEAEAAPGVAPGPGRDPPGRTDAG